MKNQFENFVDDDFKKSCSETLRHEDNQARLLSSKHSNKKKALNYVLYVEK